MVIMYHALKKHTRSTFLDVEEKIKRPPTSVFRRLGRLVGRIKTVIRV